MGAYPTGVTIVAAVDDDGSPFGLTVNSFTSLSLDPPLVLICVGRSSTWHDRLVDGRGFAVNILAAGQEEVASRFAVEPSEGRFEGVAWRAGSSGAPVLSDAAATVECTVHRVLEGGDHTILVGRVASLHVTDRPALVFHRGRFSVSAP
jgi:flavin reductase (DIM6/NTAB) family NADH-FMN oxidoreductase RutF